MKYDIYRIFVSFSQRWLSTSVIGKSKILIIQDIKIITYIS